MSSFSTRSSCEPSRGMMCKNDRKELYSKRMRRSSRRTALTPDRTALVCASSYSWANLKYRVICSTINSSFCCARLAFDWPLEMTNCRLRTISQLRQKRRQMTRRSRGRSCQPLLSRDLDGHPSHPCTMSRMSRCDKQDLIHYLEHQNLACRMKARHLLCCNNGTHPRTRSKRRSRITNDDLPIIAHAQKGTG